MTLTGDTWLGRLRGLLRREEIRRPDVIVEPAGSCLLARPAHGATPAAAVMAGTLIADPDRATVLVDPALLALDGATSHVVGAVAAPVVRLVLSGAGSGGAAAPARAAAEAHGVEVVAPDGNALVTADGCVFVHRPDGTGRWRRFRPGEPGRTLSPWHPAPEWENLLSVGEAVPGLRAVPVPAGVWLLHPDDATVPDTGDLAFAVACDLAALTLVLGRPGGLPLPPEALRAYVRSLPTQALARLRLVPYGPVPDTATASGQALADVCGMPVRVSAGLPVLTADVTHHVVALGAGGLPAWRPFATMLTYWPREGGEPAWPRVDGYRPVGPAPVESVPGTFARGGGWECEVVQCGLWLRPADPAGAPAVEVRALPPDPGGVTVVLGLPGVPVPPDAWPVLDALLADLPDEAASGLRVRVAGTVDPAGAARAGEVAGGHDVPYDLAGGVDEADGTPPLPDDAAPPGSYAFEDHILEVTAEGMSLRPAAAADASAPSPPPAPVVAGPVTPAAPPRGADVDATDDRGHLRAMLGRRYEHHLSAVDTVLAGQPALRAGLDEAARLDLMAVRVCLAGDDPGLGPGALAAALRARPDAVVRAYAARLAAGLRRLPSYRGVVATGATLTARQLAWYTPGRRLTEPGPVTASAGTGPVAGTVELLVWSVTGRRVAALVPPDRRHEVVFPPGTGFLVLRVLVDDGGATRVLLRELPATRVRHRDGDLDQEDHEMARRLTEAAAHRLRPTGQPPAVRGPALGLPG